MRILAGIMHSSSSKSSGDRDNGKFIDLDTLQTANGTRGIITQRIANGVITFSIVRVFERDGIEDWTSFFSEAQLEDFETMLAMIKERIAELRRDPKVKQVTLAGGRR